MQRPQAKLTALSYSAFTTLLLGFITCTHPATGEARLHPPRAVLFLSCKRKKGTNLLSIAVASIPTSATLYSPSVLQTRQPTTLLSTFCLCYGEADLLAPVHCVIFVASPLDLQQHHIAYLPLRSHVSSPTSSLPLSRLAWPPLSNTEAKWHLHLSPTASIFSY